MSAFIPVSPDRWAEMVQASADVGQLRSQVQDLELQVKRLEMAGDAMDAYIGRHLDGTTNGIVLCRETWQRAKNPWRQ